MGKTLSIAVVDDHQLLRNEVSRILEFQGFDVIVRAANGKELLDWVSDADVLPDICLLDINMTMMNGFDTAKKLKQDYPKIKILAYSMNNNKNIVTDILKSGADGFLFKGAHPDELKLALERLFNSPL